MTTGGEGGMVTTNKKSLWLKMWEYKYHGKVMRQSMKEIIRKVLNGFMNLSEQIGE